MNDADLKEILAEVDGQANDVQQSPSDVIPPVDRNDVTVDEDRLSAYLISSLQTDIDRREMSGWSEKREYDLKAYHGIKDAWLSMNPWPNSSNFPEPITPVLLDTGQSAIMASQFSNMLKTVAVTGIGEEDIKNADKVQNIMNWTVGTGIEDFYSESDSDIHQVLKHGTSYFKLVVDYSEDFRICPYTIPIERILLPIDSKSPKVKDTDHVHQIVPWTVNDLLYRKSLGAYRNLEYVSKGWNIQGNLTEYQLNNIRNIVTGLDITRQSNDSYYCVETYCTYYDKGSLKPKELVVWWAPGTGKILRVRENEDKIRPFADSYIYPNYGYAYHKSLPEILRPIQEKADYTEKQITDAADIAISPPTFYEEGTNFDPNIALRVPSGMYPMKNSASITTIPTNINAIMERGRHLEGLWQKAERITGFTDIFQGVQSSMATTATGDVMRQNRADVRFKHILGKVGQGWKKKCELLYYYIDKFMPRNEKVKILGTDQFSTIEQLFPLAEGKEPSMYGLQLAGKFDFNMAGKSILEVEKEKQDSILLMDSLMAHPMFGQDISTAFKAMEVKAEALGFRNLDAIVKRPIEADILSPREVINAIMSGENDVLPNPKVDPADYEFELKLFMRSENFKQADEKKKAQFQKYLFLLDYIRMAQMQAFQDFNMTEGVQQQLAQPPMMNPMQGGGQNVPPVA